MNNLHTMALAHIIVRANERGDYTVPRSHPQVVDIIRQCETDGYIKVDQVVGDTWFIAATPQGLAFSRYNEPCSKCGDHNNWYNYYSPAYGKNTETRKQWDNWFCFSCQHWQDNYERRHAVGFQWYHSLVINSGHWMTPQPGIAKGSNRDLGMSGHIYHIRNLATGEEITSNNVWHQGSIPRCWRDQFPDNAAFFRKP